MSLEQTDRNRVPERKNGHSHSSSEASKKRATGKGNGKKKADVEAGGPAPFDRRQLLVALTALKKGDFSVRLPIEWEGLNGKIADTFNDVIELNEKMAKELERLSRVVGKEGKIKLISYNGALEAIKSVYDGGLSADVVQYPEEMGKLFVEWSIRILNGEKPPEVNIHPNVSVVDTQLLLKVNLAVTGK